MVISLLNELMLVIGKLQVQAVQALQKTCFSNAA